jgi:hypothetical protein
VAVLLASGGCRLFKQDVPTLAGKSPLAPLMASPAQTQLDVCFVRLPSGDAQGMADAWEEVDEQSLPAEDRKRLARCGFRVGTFGSRLPSQLATALARATAPSGPGQLPATEGEDQIGATRHQMYLTGGQRGELVASGVLSQFHVLETRNGRPQGQTFEDGQAQFTITSEPLGDGRVRLELTPEIHYGPFQQRFAPGEGSFRFDNSRKKKVLTDLKLSATLSPGEILMISGRPDQPGSLGDRFFRETDGAAPRPRLLLLRLSPPSGDQAFQEPPSAPQDDA